MMYKKKGQLTLFVIVAILIVVGIFVYFFINSLSNKNIDLRGDGDKGDVIEDIFYDCMEFWAQDSLTEIGLRGGYYGEPVSEYLDSGGDVIPFYYYEGLRYIPTISLIELEIESLFYLKSFECFDLISQRTSNITYNYRSVNVELNDNEAVFFIDLDFIVNSDGKTSVNNYIEKPISIPSRIKAMNDFASDATLLYDIKDEVICISCYIETASYNGLDLMINTEVDSVLFFSVVDNETRNYPQIYRFLVSNFNNESETYIGGLDDEFFDVSFDEINVSSPTLED
jgi:hypothetical protein